MADTYKKIIVTGINKADLKGEKGDTGATPNITISASVDDVVGTPSVTVGESGSPEAPTFTFSFTGIRGSDANVTGTVTPTTNVGNLKMNETYEITSFQDLLNKMLVSYVAASNGSATTSAAGGTFEDGATVTVSSITISAKKGTTNITKAGANDGTKGYSVDVDSSKQKLGDTVTSTISFDKPVAITANRGGFAWTMTYLAENNHDTATLSGTTTGFTFKDKVYWGPAAKVETTQDILGLKSNKLADNVAAIGNVSQTLPEGQYLFIACPSTWGAPKFVTKLGDEAAVKVSDVEFQNASGKTKTFSIYRNSQSGVTLDSTTVAVA